MSGMRWRFSQTRKSIWLEMLYGIVADERECRCIRQEGAKVDPQEVGVDNAAGELREMDRKILNRLVVDLHQQQLDSAAAE
jgi:hypothetical protein